VDFVRVLPTLADRAFARGLAGLDDEELLGMVRSLAGSSGSRAAACDLLVSRHRNLVSSCVRRYRGGSEPAEDLMQVGYLGLMKAISRFDPAVGTNLAAYAQACISGEIKRHFRDKCWPVHVKRSVQDLVLKVRKATSQLTQDLGRAPTQSEMARYLGVSCDDLRDAQRAELASRPSSLDTLLASQAGTTTLADILGEEDRGLEHMLGMRAVAAHWGELPPREQRILRMRFQQDMTQAQIGQQLGISQIHVSRLLAHALGYLRQRLLSQHMHAPAASRAVPLDQRTAS
jgi:RNA polymerase sigma-B factor